MQKAVSFIRSCFKELASKGGGRIEKEDESEVKEGESVHQCEV